MEMISLPGGKTRMGSPLTEFGRASDEEEVTVELSPFSIGKYPVTCGEFRAVTLRGLFKELNTDCFPVCRVSWFDAVSYANSLSEREGLQPAYNVSLAAETIQHVEWDRHANGYRLPTEAEWEYAARGGSDLPWPGVAEEAGVPRIGNMRGRGPTPVGRFAPNAFGLYDTVGNVWEWCWDWYDSTYAGGADPTGPHDGLYRVRRGGSWLSDAYYLRVAIRDYGSPYSRFNDLGFRLARNRAG